VIEVRVLYFDGCPHWETMRDRVREALHAEGLDDVEPVPQLVETPEDAEKLRFIGSPTIRIDGRDPFEGSDAGYGLSCRVYQTPSGPAGSPTVEQLRLAFRAA
jgi:hypothetical protein